MKPKVIVAPEFRRMDEIFDPPTLERLHDLVDVQWGRDGPMPQEAFMAALQDATAVVLCKEHGMALRVMNINTEGALRRIVQGEAVGTLVTSGEES